MEKFDLGFPTGLLRIISYTNDFLRKIIKMCCVTEILLTLLGRELYAETSNRQEVFA